MHSSLLYASLGLCASAARILPPTGSQQWNFTLEAKGKVSGTVGQISNGQNRIGGNYTVAEFKFVKLGDDKTGGVIFDSKNRGCIVTPPSTTQWQCDQGRAASPGWDFDCSNQLLYHGSSAFWACPVNDKGEWNIYITPDFGQNKCTPITLSIRGGALRPTGCVKQSVVSTGTSPAHPANPKMPPPKPTQAKPSHSPFLMKPNPSPSSLATVKPSSSSHAAKPKPAPSSSQPSASPSRPSTTPSRSGLPMPKIEGKLITSPDGTCGPRTNYTCLGFRLGSCCSPFGWCGATTPFCGVGCQSSYGKCDVFLPEDQPSQPSMTSSSLAKPLTSSLTSARLTVMPHTKHEDDEDTCCHCHDGCSDDWTDEEDEYGFKLPPLMVPPLMVPPLMVPPFMEPPFMEPSQKLGENAKGGHGDESNADNKHGNYTPLPHGGVPTMHIADERVPVSSSMLADKKHATQTRCNSGIQRYTGATMREGFLYGLWV